MTPRDWFLRRKRYIEFAGESLSPQFGLWSRVTPDLDIDMLRRILFSNLGHSVSLLTRNRRNARCGYNIVGVPASGASVLPFYMKRKNNFILNYTEEFRGLALSRLLSKSFNRGVVASSSDGFFASDESRYKI